MPHRGTLIVLIHSPLVGPHTWSAVAKVLSAAGRRAIVPELQDDGGAPFWSQHAESVKRSFARGTEGQRLMLIAHSGAGPLLPAIVAACSRPVAGYAFVDAGLPAIGSRLDAMEREDVAFARHLREALTSGKRYPAWTDEDLRTILPDAYARTQLIASLRPRGLDFFTEPFPENGGWPDAPCAYLQFSRAYDVPAAEARARGWPVVSLDAGHFHMLVDPAGVTRALLDLINRADIDLDG